MLYRYRMDAIIGFLKRPTISIACAILGTTVTAVAEAGGENPLSAITSSPWAQFVAFCGGGTVVIVFILKARELWIDMVVERVCLDCRRGTPPDVCPLKDPCPYGLAKNEQLKSNHRISTP